jgi:hypothetical protein
MNAATKPPLPQPAKKAPNTAGHISGRSIRMSTNTLGLRELTLKFDGSAEAKAELLVDGHKEHFLVGLDGVERFSPSTLVDLPAACRGEWIGKDAFLLQINLVGGINFYMAQLTFSNQSNKVIVNLSERTGLNEEQFSGVVSDY